MATYELLPEGKGIERAKIVAELSVMEIGQLLFDDGQFWSVKRIESASSRTAEALLILTPAVAVHAPPPKPAT